MFAPVPPRPRVARVEHSLRKARVNLRLQFPPLRRLPLVLLLATSSTGLFASPAWAAANDAEAEALREQAIFDDYLNLRFGEAETKLNRAVQMCDSGCSNAVKARLYRDLGVVYIAGLKQRDAGIGMFVEAVVLDPSIQLDPDLSSEELQQALAEARELAGSAPPPSAEGSKSSAGVQPPPKHYDILPVEEFEGVFHTPPEEQLVNTPLPIYVEVNDADWTAKVDRVVLHYRGFGMVRFKEVPLQELGKNGYAIEIDCKEVGMSPGKLDYYVTIVDEDGDAAADVGTEQSPHSVEIKTEIEHSPQPLPGKKLPAQCDMPEAGSVPGMSASPTIAADECPPDFPGCGEAEFEDDFDDEIEVPEHARFPQHWVSLGGQLDFLWMHDVPDACTGNYTSEYHCFEGDLYWDPSVPGRTNDFEQDGIIDGGGTTSGGLALATQRLLLGYDFALTHHVLIGARLGIAFGGGPQLVDQDPLTPDDNPEFMPLHAELRGAYWFGDPVTQSVRPFLQLSGGAAQVDAGLETEVIDLSGGRSCVEGPDPATGQPVPSCRVPVTAWRKTGTFFVSAGAGAMFSVSKNVGILVEARYMHLLPASGAVLAGGAGVAVGF